MKSQSKHKKIPLTLLLLAFLVLAPAAMAASISTDQEDYAPWEIVTINGSGFEPASDMTVTVEWPDGYVDEFYGTADDSGGFSLTYGKEKYEGTFIVTAEDSAGNTATTTFTDATNYTTDTTLVAITSPLTAGQTGVSYSGQVLAYKPNKDRVSVPDGAVVKLQYQLSGGSTSDIATTTTMTTMSGNGIFSSTFTAPPAGTYQFRAWFDGVSSGQGQSAVNWQSSHSEWQTVVVNAAPQSDKTPPVITPTITGTLGNNGWYVSDVTVTWTVTDPESAVTSVVYNPLLLPHTVTVDTAGTTFTCTATSAGGTSSVSVTIKRDATPPSLTWGAITPAPNDAGWNNTPVTISYTLDGGNVSGVASAVPESPLSFNAEGAGQTQTVTVTDNAGNSATFTSPAVNIDGTPPVITAGTPTGTPGNDPWWISDVTVPFSATDNLSGFAPNGALLIDLASNTTVGEGTVLYVTSDGISDRAGNPALVIQAGPFKVDKTAPEITINAPVEGALYLLNEEVFADWSATDLVSGVASDSATLNGTTIAKGGLLTGSVGAKTFIVTATNGAGLTASQPVSYKVQYKFGGFLPPVSLDGRSLFKLGSTIPVKFQLFDAAGNPVSTAVATIKVAKMSDGTAGTEVEAVSTSAATTGNLFRYDSTGQLYIFNLATKTLSVGSWRIRVYLDDGTSQYVDIGIKK